MRFISLLFLISVPLTAPAQVEPESLRRGLVTTHRDPGGAEVVRLEPTVALALGTNEAAHPRLAADGGTVTWQGFINVTRADSYRFRVRLRGSFRLTVGGKEVLAAESKDEVALKEGPEVRLEAGVLPITAVFTRPSGDARLELLWRAKHFREEPLPFDVLGHVPGKAPDRLNTDAVVEEGRRLVEEHACMRCHLPGEGMLAKTLQPRLGPDLSKVGGRVHGEWIHRWLDEPRKMRPAAVMPRVLADGEAGAAERYAVTRYLVSLGGPVVERGPKPNRDAIQRGQKLFTSVGCVVCHGPVGETKPVKQDEEERTFTLHAAPTLYPFKGLGGKTTPEQLAAYLRNPHALNPTSRMPNMLLEAKEALDLAQFLCDASGPKDHKLPDAPGGLKAVVERHVTDVKARETILKLPAEEQWPRLGRHLVEAKGCVACHTIAPEGKALPAYSAKTGLEQLTGEKQKAGCLAEDDKQRGPAPRFALDTGQRSAIRAFLSGGLKGAGSPAPAYQAQNTLHRLNCLACHGRDGEGGLASSLVEQLRKFEKAENAEAVVPPPLTGVGHKLRTPWLREVLTRAGRARPWMGLRMPQFGEANVGPLADHLAALEGVDPSDAIHRVALTGEKVGAGRFLVGKEAFGCVSCHDIAGIPNHGTRGPDLARMTERVRFDWYERWLENAQRIQPGTRMPTVFPDGKSLVSHILKGDAGAQAEAMWAYASLGPTLPLPEGIQVPGRGIVLGVKDRPVVFRSFLPEAGTRAIAVGFPAGVSVAFDPTTCRLAYGWTGSFLDVGPVWNDRGGNPARPLGPRFWTAPAGCPLGLTVNNEPLDFQARAKDPAFGAALPEGKLPPTPAALHFKGYRTYSHGAPVFLYRVGAKDEESVQVEELAGPLRHQSGVGVRREFNLTVPGKNQTVWLRAAESDTEPAVYDDRGAPIKVQVKENGCEVPAGDALVVKQSGRTIVLKASRAPKGSQWYLHRAGGKWQVLLRLPATAEGAAYSLTVDVWSPHRDEPNTIRELMMTR